MAAVNDTAARKDVTIANNAATSGYFDTRGAKRIRVYVPAAWTGADLTAMAKDALTTKPGLITPVAAPVRLMTGTALAKISGIKTAEAGWYTAPDDWLGHSYLALRSTNTASEADVNQGAARSLVVNVTY